MGWINSIGGWLLLPVLIFIALEDFKYRAVRWWIFPLAGLIGIGVEFSKVKFIDIGLNLGFLIIQLAMLSLYFSVKENKIVNITNNHLGRGDIAFWLFCTLLFSVLNFVFFFIVSLLISMILALGWKLVKQEQKFNTIPLAGMQAIVLSVILLIKNFTNSFYFRNDAWIERLIIE